MKRPAKRFSQGTKARRAMAEKLGRDMKRAGVKVGRSIFPSGKFKNFDTYQSIMRGMGYGIRRSDLRNPRGDKRTY